MVNNKIQLNIYANFRHYSSTDEQQRANNNGRQRPKQERKKAINWQKRATCTFIVGRWTNEQKKKQKPIERMMRISESFIEMCMDWFPQSKISDSWLVADELCI